MHKQIHNKRLLGVHLNLLTELFSGDPKPLVNREIAHLLGLPSISWHNMTSAKQLGLVPIKDVHLSILLRFVLHHPDQLQRLRFPEAKQLKARCERTMQEGGTLSDRIFSLVLARQVACGHRWLQVGKPWDAMTARLALVLEHFLDQGGTLDEWMRLYIRPEARRRGINPEKMTTLALPNDIAPLTFEEQIKPISTRLLTNNDLAEFQGDYEIEPGEIGYIIGLHQNRWTDLMSRPPELPLIDASLCVFLRYLMDHPEAINIFRLPKYTALDAVKAFRQKKCGTRYVDQQIMALIGLRPYALHRSAGINTPKFRRVLSHFIAALENDRYEDWIEVVDEEARSRGIPGGLVTVLEDGWKDSITRTEEVV